MLVFTPVKEDSSFATCKMHKALVHFLILTLVVAFLPGQSQAAFHQRPNMDAVTFGNHDHASTADRSAAGHEHGKAAIDVAAAPMNDEHPCSDDPAANKDCCWAACAGVGFVVVSTFDPAQMPESTYEFAIAQLLTPATLALDAPPPR